MANLINEIQDPLFIETNDASTLYECNHRKTQRITNLIQNGSFEVDINGWTESSGEHIAECVPSEYAIDGENVLHLKNNDDSKVVYLYTDFPTIPSEHVIYARVTGWIGETVERARFFTVQDGVNNLSNQGTYILHSDMSETPQTKSIYKKLTQRGSRIYLGGFISGSQEGWYDGIMVIDLTDCFGAGNEPTKEWCDTHIDYFSGSTDVVVSDYYEIKRVGQFSSPSIQHLSYVKINGQPEYDEIYIESKYECNYVSGHKYYVSVDVKANRNDAGYNVYFPVSTPYPNINGTEQNDDSFVMHEQNMPDLKENTWIRSSMIYSTNSIPSGKYHFRLDNDNAKTNTEICFANLIVIDLTSAYGAGNEPTLGWLNNNIVLDADGTPKIKTSSNDDIAIGVNGFNYINYVMKQPSKKIYTKIQYMDKDERVLGEIHGRCIGGSINIANSEMVRRTLSMDFLANDKLEIKSGSPFWLDKKLKIFTGVEDIVGNIYWYNQGIFVPMKPQTNVSLSGRTISLEASDKFCLADTYMEGNELITVDTPIPTAIMKLMEYADLTNKTIINNDDYVLPYDFEAVIGDKVLDKVQEIQNLYMDYECYYDLNGYLVFDKTKNRVNDVPVWSFKDDYDFTINRTITSDYNEIYNEFYMYGYLDAKTGIQPTYHMELPASHPFSRQNTGRKHMMVIQDDTWDNVEQCRVAAEYQYNKTTNMINEFSIVCAPIYTLNEVNKVIKVTDNGNEYTCLVDNITYPLGIGDSMTIGCHEIFADEEVNMP